MNQWLLIRRLRGPAYILLVGIMALLDEWHIIGWGKSWPLFLIMAGVLALAERAALAQADLQGYPPPGPYSGQSGGTTYGGGPAGPPVVSASPATPASGIDSGEGRQ